MKKFVNEPAKFVPEFMKGVALANPDWPDLAAGASASHFCRDAVTLGWESWQMIPARAPSISRQMLMRSHQLEGPIRGARRAARRGDRRHHSSLAHAPA